MFNPIFSPGARVHNNRRFPNHYNFKKYLLRKQLSSHFIALGFLQLLALFELLFFLSFQNRQPVVLETLPFPIQQNTTLPLQPPVKIPSFKEHKLFANPDSLGAIALGIAEGTRTTDGGFTSKYFGHTDYGNGRNNLGTFSYQHTASSPLEADLKQLKNLQDWADQMQEDAKKYQVKWGLFEFLAGVDLFNQAPAAGKYYVKHLKKCQTQDKLGEDAILCARLQAYHNPRTGELEAAGFNNDIEHLELDQKRRIRAILTALPQDQFQANHP